MTLALAVECKNLRPHNPLLLSAVPRTDDEAFHDALYFWDRPTLEYCQVEHLTGHRAAYKTGEMVGKKTDQVGREDRSGGDLTSNDEATFDKLNQAVNSCQDLVQYFAKKRTSPFRRVVAPVLVVPTGILWQVDYDADGSVAMEPRPVERASLYYDYAWSVPSAFGEALSYRLSHIEIVTFDALGATTKAWLGAGGFFPLA